MWNTYAFGYYTESKSYKAYIEMYFSWEFSSLFLVRSSNNKWNRRYTDMKLPLCLAMSVKALRNTVTYILVLFLTLSPSFLKLHGTYSFIAQILYPLYRFLPTDGDIILKKLRCLSTDTSWNMQSFIMPNVQCNFLKMNACVCVRVTGRNLAIMWDSYKIMALSSIDPFLLVSDALFM